VDQVIDEARSSHPAQGYCRASSPRPVAGAAPRMREPAYRCSRSAAVTLRPRTIGISGGHGVSCVLSRDHDDVVRALADRGRKALCGGDPGPQIRAPADAVAAALITARLRCRHRVKPRGAARLLAAVRGERTKRRAPLNSASSD